MLIRRLKVLPTIKRINNNKTLDEKLRFNYKISRYYSEKITVDINEGSKTNNTFDLDAHLKNHTDFLYSYSINNFITRDGRKPTEYKPETVAKRPEDFGELIESSPKTKELNDALLKYKMRKATWEECYRLIEEYNENGIRPDYNTIRILREITEKEIRENVEKHNLEDVVSLPDPVLNESLSKSLFTLVSQKESFDPDEVAQEFKRFNPPIDLHMLVDQYNRFVARNKGEMFIKTAEALKNVNVIDDVLFNAFLNSIKK